MTGLTDRQAVLLELAGMLEMVTWKVSTARVAFSDDKAAADYLKKVELGLERLRRWSTENGWRSNEPSLRNRGDAVKGR